MSSSALWTPEPEKVGATCEDPGFQYGVVLAKTNGRAVLRLANADILPFEFGRSAASIARFADEVMKIPDDLRRETEERNRRLDAKLYEAVADPTQTWVAPKRLDAVPYINFAPLQNAAAALKKSAAAYAKAWSAATADGKMPPLEVQKQLDQILMKTERALTRKEGLPRRPWFTHQMYVPGFYTGYGVKTMPGVREALEQRNWQEASEQVGLLAETIEGFAREIDRAAGVLGGR